jgi:SAM-dependent methyltransferase
MTLIEVAQTSRDFIAAYDVLAPSYDAFTGNGDYTAWAAGLVGEAQRQGISGGAAVEVGCGTGRTTLALLAAGFRVTAYDPSETMLDRARARVGTEADLRLGGLPDLPPGERAQLVMVLNDVLNYVPAEDLGAAMAAIAARTAPRGVVLFDLNTAWTYEQGIFATTFVRRADGRLFVSEPVAMPAPGVHAFDLHVITPTGPGPEACTHVVSSHRHWHHPHAAVVAALRDAGLELAETLGQHDDGRRDPHFDEAAHSKRVYLARRP